MKYAYLSLGMILYGMVGLGFIVLFENVTINNESEYYVLHEAVEASMYESFDMMYFRETNGQDVKIIEEKFVANCTRRFFNSISGAGNGYTLTFYDIIESPPKVSVVANSSTDSYSAVGLGGEDGFDIKNALSAILEYDNIFGVVTYKSDESNCNGKTLSVAAGQKYGSLCVPASKTGYKFIGWNTGDSCATSGFVTNDSVVVRPLGDVSHTLTACYKAESY